AALGWFALGALAKESAYAFVPLVLLFWWRRERGNFGIVGATAAVAVVLLAVRVWVIGGLGGYPDESGVSPNFAIGLKTFTSFFTRALPAPLFLINTDASIPWYARAAAVGFAAWAVIQAWTSGGRW